MTNEMKVETIVNELKSELIRLGLATAMSLQYLLAECLAL